MRKSTWVILIIGTLAGLISCRETRSIDEARYLGNFSEKRYAFFESFQHNTDANYYAELPYDLKFGGIRPFPYDSARYKDYSWLRNPENLKMAFSAFSIIGLDKFVSKEKYFQKSRKWCCDTQWEGKSLDEIVTGFIKSDTTSTGTDYYAKFWQRRKFEDNREETYEILVQIDRFYNEDNREIIYGQTNRILLGLLKFDVALIRADSTEYKTKVIDYFSFLKAAELYYSAYKLIYNNPRLDMTKSVKDSLIMTLDHDTLSIDDWKNLNDNIDGWITSDRYPDPDRYYGP